MDWYFSRRGHIRITWHWKLFKAKLDDDAISIKPNTNTLKCEFTCKHNVDFTVANSLAEMFGLERTMYTANTIITSSNPLSISKVNSIQIEVNIVCGSYQNGMPSDCIYKCFLHVPPGFRITEIPNNVIYLPLNTDEIDRIVVKLVDERHNLINFRGEEISLELHLKIWLSLNVWKPIKGEHPHCYQSIR